METLRTAMSSAAFATAAACLLAAAIHDLRKGGREGYWSAVAERWLLASVALFVLGVWLKG